MHRIVVVLAILALSFAPAGLAHAQLGAPNVPTPLQEPPPPPPVDNDLGEEGLSGFQQALIFVGAGLVLAGIGFVIVRDARKSAAPDPRAGKGAKSGAGKAPPSAKPKPKGNPAAVAAVTDSSASAIRARERQQAKRAKAKAKAVRDQRKRNRPR